MNSRSYPTGQKHMCETEQIILAPRTYSRTCTCVMIERPLTERRRERESEKIAAVLRFSVRYGFVGSPFPPSARSKMPRTVSTKKSGRRRRGGDVKRETAEEGSKEGRRGKTFPLSVQSASGETKIELREDQSQSE